LSNALSGDWTFSKVKTWDLTMLVRQRWWQCLRRCYQWW
jgi:hypothetical protein